MAELKVRPLGDRVVIEPIANEERTASGIIIPDTAKEKPQRGTVRAVGNGTKEVTMEVKVGDIVLYSKYGGTEVTVDDVDYIIMRQNDILAVI